MISIEGETFLNRIVKVVKGVVKSYLKCFIEIG